MKPARLRSAWRGELPRVGHFLKSARGRTAYEIGTLRIVREDGDGCRHLALVCTRWPAGDMPEHAIVHEIVWNKRTKRAA